MPFQGARDAAPDLPDLRPASREVRWHLNLEAKAINFAPVVGNHQRTPNCGVLSGEWRHEMQVRVDIP